MPKWCRLGNREVVCSADLGINTDVVASIVANDGTVVARSFIDRASHIDRRDRGLASIRSRARQTMGGRPCASKIGDNAGMQPLADFIGQAGRLDADPEAMEKLLSKASRGTQGSTAGRLSDGFCRKAYRRARGLNLQVARDLACELIAFAVKHGARVIVFEDLKGFRPRGGRRGSTMRQRFHGWLHRLLVRQVTSTFVERGGKVATVYARGTSSYAYDGSGKVRRQSWNRALTVFANGRHYNADLNASYNIGARWWVQEWRKVSAAAKRAVDAVLTPCPSTAPSSKLPLASRKAGETFPGRSSRKVPRMPITLSSLWRLVEVLEGEKLQLCSRA